MPNPLIKKKRSKGISTSPRLTSVMKQFYRQRHRYESTLYLRSVDNNPQARPLCQRADCRSSADVLVNFQRDQSKGVFENPSFLKTKTAQHIGSCTPTKLSVFEFQLEATFFRPLHLRHGLKAQHDGVLHIGTSAKNDNTKSGKIKSGGTNGKSGQRQIHVQIGSGKLVAGEYCVDCC